MTSRTIAVALLVAAALPSCLPEPRSAVSFRLHLQPKTPRDASVTIDEEYIGPLGWVASRGVRMPEGVHRITIERDR